MAKGETLQHAVSRMRREGWSEEQIQGQVHRWHPQLGSNKRTANPQHQQLLDASQHAFNAKSLDPIASLPVKATGPTAAERAGYASPFTHDYHPIAPPIHGTPSRNVWQADRPIHTALDVVSGRRSLTGRRVNEQRVLLRRDPKVKGSKDFTVGDAISMGLADAPLAATGLARQFAVQAAQRAVDNPAGVAAEIGHPIRTTRQLALNTAETARRPWQHPFDAALLGWAVASGSASLAERAAMAARGRGFVRAPLETAQLETPGGIKVEYPLSRNPIAKRVQRGRAGRLQAKLDQGPRERIPRSKLGRAFVRGLDVFGPEAKVRRELRSERVTEEAILQGPLAEMHDAVQHLNRGEHTALRLAAIEGDAALGAGPGAVTGALAPAGPVVHLANSKTLRGGYIPKPATYLRLGEPPSGQKASMNWLSGKREEGVSIYAAWKDPRTGKYVVPSGSEQYVGTFGEISDRPIYEVTGRELPGATGDDGEPLLDPATVKIVRQVQPDSVVPESDPNLALDGTELSSAQTPDWHPPSEVGLIQRHMDKAMRDHADGALSDQDYQAEMADLKLAAPVIANPSDRFLKALDKTRGLSQNTEGMLVDRGLLQTDTAAGRRAKIADLYQPGGYERAAERSLLKSHLEDTRPPKDGEEADLRTRLAENVDEQRQPYTQTHLRRLRREQSALNDRLQEIEQHKHLATLDAPPAPEGSFYFPLSQRYTHSLLHSADNVRMGTPSISDLGAPRASPSAAIGSLQKEFTGKATKQRLPADIVARGLSQRYARTVRLTSAHDLFDRLYQAGSDVKRSEYDVPLRLTANAREEIKKVLAKASDKLEANPDAAELLTQHELEALSKTITVDEPGITGAPVGGPPIKDVRWVDRRIMPEADISTREGFQKAFDLINNPIRFADLYIRPAYALNALGNAGMALITQGHMAPANIRNALRIVSQLGEGDASKVRAGMGESRSQSYLAGGGREYRALGAHRDTKTGRFARRISNQSLAHLWNRVTDVWFRDSAFYQSARQAGYDTPEKISQLLNDPKLAGARRQVFRRARKDSVDFQSMTKTEKDYIRRVVYFYPWMSRASIWALRAVIEHPGKAYTLAALARIGGERSDEATGPQPGWLDQIGPIAVGGDSKHVKLLNPTSINTFSTPAEAGRAAVQTVLNTIGVGTGKGGLSDVATPGAALFAQEAGGGGDTAQGFGLAGAAEGTPQYQALRRLGVIGKPPATYPATGVAAAFGPFAAGGLYPRAADKAVIADQYRKQQSKSTRGKQARARTETLIDAAVRRGQITPEQAQRAKQALSTNPEDRRLLVIDSMHEQGYSDDEINKALGQLGYDPIGG